MAVEQGAACLSVMTDDTGVYILLLHYYNQKQLNIPMFMESCVHGREDKLQTLGQQPKSMLTFYQTF